MSAAAKKFAELASNNPCEGCPAPCCQMQVMPWVKPQSLMSIDHMRFSLLFPDTEFIVAESGEFSLVKWQKCTILDTEKASCTVHSTPDQPLTCVHFNPHQCWYKRNFVDTDQATDVFRLNMERYEAWVENIEFGADSNVTAFPEFEEAQDIVRNIPITPNFESSPSLIKSEK